MVNFCLTEGVKKLCYISSIATLGKTTDGSLSTEETEFNPEEDNSVYAITKHEAEMQVWRGTQEGLDAIIIHPGVIIGEGIWSSASGGIFRTISKGLSYYTPGGVSIVDVKDVVKAMINLTTSTIKNEAYILVAKNIYYKELLTKISDSLNKKPPNKTIAKWMMISFVNLDWLLYKVFRIKRKLLKATVRSLYKTSFYDASKIKEVLEFKFTPSDKTIERVARNYKRDIKF